MVASMTRALIEKMEKKDEKLRAAKVARRRQQDVTQEYDPLTQDDFEENWVSGSSLNHFDQLILYAKG